ncbi:MAG TPA: Clp protease N-terminal domain-containing protein [Acidimicrobiales bacterium]|nr:Clp protease N-terminal domain-containing protein [Acidimicrobiales bacterium]
MASAVMTPEVDAVLKSAAQIAMSWNHHWVGTEHLLLALIGARAPSGLMTASLTYEATEAAVKKATPPLPEREVEWGGVVQTPRVRNILGIAEGWALAATWPDQATIDLTSFAFALLREGEGIATQVLVRSGADLPAIISALAVESRGG